MEKFRVVLSSDLDYEGMVVNIYYLNATVARVVEDKDPSKMKIEIFSPPEGEKTWEFLFDDFIELLQEAKKILMLRENE